MQYPALFDPAPEGGYVVTFRDVPEAITQGDDDAEAMEMAEDALVCCMDFYFDDGRVVRSPSPAQEGERMVALPPSLAAKVLLHNSLIETGVSKAELARRMGRLPQEIARITSPRYTTKIDTLADALAALGKRLDVVLR